MQRLTIKELPKTRKMQIDEQSTVLKIQNKVTPIPNRNSGRTRMNTWRTWPPFMGAPWR